MLGTIVNTGCIIVGSIVGSLLKKGLGEKYQNVLYNAMGLASLALGANTFVQNMPKSEFPVLFILSIALGGIVGAALDLDGRTKRLIAKRGGGISETFTVRRISYGVGVEKTFPIHSPNVEKVETIRRGKVRRAKLYYLRDRVGKAAKTKEDI